MAEQGISHDRDRRDEKRVAADLTGVLTLSNGGKQTVTVRNIGLGGAFLECDGALKVGDRGSLSVSVSYGGRSHRVEAPVEVTHGPTRVSLTVHGHGVNFIELDDEAAEALERYVEMRPAL